MQGLFLLNFSAFVCAILHGMGSFNRDRGSFGGNRNFGKRGFGDRQNSRPQMHNAICSNCGKECQVPFRPTGEKPVYCRECFAKMQGGDSRPSFDRNERPAFNAGNQDRGNQSLGDEQLKDINRKLDKILAFLAPKMEKPVEVAPVVMEAPVAAQNDEKPASKARKSAKK